MKHNGKAPAIYASKRRAYLLQPGDRIPAQAKIVVSHTNLDVLALTFGRSTYGNPDGTRAPSNGAYANFRVNAEAVLRRVVNQRVGEIFDDQFQVLLHALGSARLSSENPDLGWRNYYKTHDGDSVVLSLVERGLMEKAEGDYYRVTARGKVFAGAPEKL